MALSLAKKQRQAKRRRVIISVIVVIAAIFIAYGTWGLSQGYIATHQAHPTVTKAVITHSTSTPHETDPVDACAAYKVAAQQPQRIDIPSVNADGCLEQVGLDQNGAIAVPDNIYTAAWYVKSVLPGQPGLSVIDGHISGIYSQTGIFQYLYKLKSGDTFTVTLGSGQILHYKVFREQSVPLNDAVNVLLAKDTNVVSQLNLITCGGQYDKSSKLYDHRIIVSATVLNS